jgi:hypothetical protein
LFGSEDDAPSTFRIIHARSDFTTAISSCQIRRDVDNASGTGDGGRDAGDGTPDQLHEEPEGQRRTS